jgi:hypothetical protein
MCFSGAPGAPVRLLEKTELKGIRIFDAMANPVEPERLIGTMPVVLQGSREALETLGLFSLN